MPIPNSPELAKEETLCYLEIEREPWLILRERVARTAGLDAQLNAAFESSNQRMNYLLEDLFRQIAVVVPIYDYSPEKGITFENYDQYRKAA